jgi:type III pantothenate kinase
MRATLHARAAQLPIEGGAYTEFAADTEDALASGCEGAAIALVERSLAVATQGLGRAPRVLLHGGGADALRAHLLGVESRPALVLEGLARWAALETAA